MEVLVALGLLLACAGLAALILSQPSLEFSEVERRQRALEVMRGWDRLKVETRRTRDHGDGDDASTTRMVTARMVLAYGYADKFVTLPSGSMVRVPVADAGDSLRVRARFYAAAERAGVKVATKVARPDGGQEVWARLYR